MVSQIFETPSFFYSNMLVQEPAFIFRISWKNGTLH